MSWSDDTRCLFCDGKLPLYRKLAQGQFCSKAHQESYWKEQDQLAVAALHRTHDALQAYKPTVSIESILGPAPVVPVAAPVFVDTDPPLAGLLSQTAGIGPVRAEWTILAVDPVEYDVAGGTAVPELEATPVLIEQDADTLYLSEPEDDTLDLSGLEAGVVELPEVPGKLAEPVVLEAQGPELDLASAPEAPELAVAAGATLPTAGQAAWEPFAPLSCVAPVDHSEPSDFAAGIVQVPLHRAAPEGDAFEQLESEAFPFIEASFALSAPGMAQGAFPPARGTVDAMEFAAPAPLQPLAAQATALNCAPRLSEQLLGLTLRIAPLTPAVNGTHLQVLDPQPGVPLLGALALPPATSDPTPAGLRPLPDANGVDQEAVVAAIGEQNIAWLPAAVRVPALAVAAKPLAIRARAEVAFPLDLIGRIQPNPGSRKARGAVVASPIERDVLLPRISARAFAATEAFDAARALMAAPASRQLLAGAMNFWNHAPRDLKMLLFAVPIAVGLAFHPSLPKVSVQAPQNSAKDVPGLFQRVVSDQVATVKKAIADRAAIGLDENFRQGLDNWMGNSGSTAEWSFDQAGFVQPGRVALYQPSLGLSDYELQFLGAIDKGALSWVVRAIDFQNYYVVKLSVVKPGVVPQLGITRYAVIDGKAVDRVDTPVALNSRTDSLYRVSMEMQGDHFALTIQGQVIDSWTEKRLKRGGVGFFTNRGEQSRIGWVQITHQYDALGRLFAYLAP